MLFQNRRRFVGSYLRQHATVLIVAICQQSLSRSSYLKRKEPTTMSKHSHNYRLCVLASGSLITDIFNFRMLISVSCLHFGQKRGKFLSSVSSRIFILVLFPHIGHKIHFSLCTTPPQSNKVSIIIFLYFLIRYK